VVLVVVPPIVVVLVPVPPHEDGTCNLFAPLLETAAPELLLEAVLTILVVQHPPGFGRAEERLGVWINEALVFGMAVLDIAGERPEMGPELELDASVVTPAVPMFARGGNCSVNVADPCRLCQGFNGAEVAILVIYVFACSQFISL